MDSGRPAIGAAATEETAAAYRASGWWSAEPLGERIRRLAGSRPAAPVYLSPGGALSWSDYDRAGDLLAAGLVEAGLERGARVAVYLPDSPLLHAVFLAGERAGVVLVGIPERAGDRELAHLITTTGAELLICPAEHRGRTAAALLEDLAGHGAPLRRHAEARLDGSLIVSDRDPAAPASAAPVPAARVRSIADRQTRPDELWLLNSTSGTTGLPKCVRQTQNRWLYLVGLAVQGADLGADDVLMSVVPGSFGFGLWTGHFAPAVLGVPCVLHERFDAGEVLRAVAEHRVTVLACVTTQFQLMLAHPLIDEVDLSSLRVLYTGGEAVPTERAREWERRTGSTVLQFYGSNEIGPFSCTSLGDSEDRRLGTVGRVVDGLDYRIFDDAGRDVTATGGPGQPGGCGPGAYGGGYWDEAANAGLFSDDGYLLMPDLVAIDEEGYVRITGRKSDIIIRGGKNLSAGAIEAGVARHPAVDMVAAVAVPDPVFGERACAVVTLQPTARGLELDELVAFLAGEGVSKEYLPEFLVVVEEMPISMGGKIAKAELRSRLPDLLGSAGHQLPAPSPAPSPVPSAPSAPSS